MLIPIDNRRKKENHLRKRRPVQERRVLIANDELITTQEGVCESVILERGCDI